MAAEFAVIKIIKCLISGLALNFLLGIRQTAERFCRFTIFPQLGLVAFVAIPSGTALKVSLTSRMQFVFLRWLVFAHMMAMRFGHHFGRISTQTQYGNHCHCRT